MPHFASPEAECRYAELPEFCPQGHRGLWYPSNTRMGWCSQCAAVVRWRRGIAASWMSLPWPIRIALAAALWLVALRIGAPAWWI